MPLWVKNPGVVEVQWFDESLPREPFETDLFHLQNTSNYHDLEVKLGGLCNLVCVACDEEVFQSLSEVIDHCRSGGLHEENEIEYLKRMMADAIKIRKRQCLKSNITSVRKALQQLEDFQPCCFCGTSLFQVPVPAAI